MNVIHRLIKKTKLMILWEKIATFTITIDIGKKWTLGNPCSKGNIFCHYGFDGWGISE
jgi:hypothetical protein